MRLVILCFGAVLQFVALYIAFYSEMHGNIYLATLVSVVSICCLITIRSLLAPACLLAGIVVGLSLSHNKADLMLLTQWEQTIQNVMRAEFIKSPSQDLNLPGKSKYSTNMDNELVVNPAINLQE